MWGTKTSGPVSSISTKTVWRLAASTAAFDTSPAAARESTTWTSSAKWRSSESTKPGSA